ncbi:MAG: zinc-ribbon domain-containing protein, partial [Proteobacteria bacterium]|nr:zinc-ribbon domain-containing protein [Pseudomonadota bacterium]
MKFLCDRCKTRYSIGDDRVRGKILKIRCKNCANVITVREGMADVDAVESMEAKGDGPRRQSEPTTMAPPVTSQAPAPPSAPTGNGRPKPPAALEEEWYVSLDGDQEGPYSLADAQRWVASRAFDAELHCWSEGFDDWLPVDKVSHFRGLRKKPTVAGPPPLPRLGTSTGAGQSGPARALTAPAEDEPKPLFAATMASLEKGLPAQPSTNGFGMPPRATPATGLPAATGTGSTPARTTAPAAAVKPAAIRAPIPGFDLDLGESTAIEQVPFADEPRAKLDAPKPVPLAALAAAVSTPSKPMTTPMPAPMMPPPMTPPAAASFADDDDD